MDTPVAMYCLEFNLTKKKAMKQLSTYWLTINKEGKNKILEKSLIIFNH